MQPVALSRFLTVAFFPRFDAGNEGFYIFFRLLVLSGNFLLVTDIEQWRPVVRHLHRKGGIQLHPSCRQHPLVAGDRQTPLAINDKKVALSGAGGAAGTAKCREKLTELLTLPFIRADVMTGPQTGIQLNKEAWTEGRMILTETQRESLRSQVDALLEYIG